MLPRAPPGSPPGGFLLSDLVTLKETDDRIRATDARHATIVLAAVLYDANLSHDLAASRPTGPGTQRLCNQIRCVWLQVSGLACRNTAFDALDEPVKARSNLKWGRK